MDQKKFEERITLDVLLTFLDKNGSVSVVNGEEPDFIINDNGTNIGVEIAKVFYNNDNFIGINANKLKTDLIKYLSNRGLYQRGIKDKSSDYGYVYQYVKSYQVLLPPFIIEELDAELRQAIVNSFDNWINAGMNSNEMFSVYDRYYPYTDVELIYMTASMPIMEGDNLAPINENHPLHKIINHKNELLHKNYKQKNPNVKEWWLCLEITTDSTISACKYSFDTNYPNSFDRVFIVDPHRLRVYEIERRNK